MTPTKDEIRAAREDLEFIRKYLYSTLAVVEGFRLWFGKREPYHGELEAKKALSILDAALKQPTIASIGEISVDGFKMQPGEFKIFDMGDAPTREDGAGEQPLLSSPASPDELMEAIKSLSEDCEMMASPMGEILVDKPQEMARTIMLVIQAAEQCAELEKQNKYLERDLRHITQERDALNEAYDAISARLQELEKNAPFFKIRSWAQDRNLIEGATTHAQMIKLMEEVGELAKAIGKKDTPEIIDGIGDCVVVLTILAAQNGLRIENCIESAYNEIKDRKGKMVNGLFMKEGK